MHLAPIKIEETRKQLSAKGGLLAFAQLFDALALEKTLGPCLPIYKIKTGTSAYDKFRTMVLGLVAGADCLDEMDRLAADPAFAAIVGKTNASNTYGEYLRAFSLLGLKNLRYLLIDMALKMREQVSKKAKASITIKFDSTSHEQHGLKTEGVEKNYKGQMALDSLLAFDELGFQYWSDVRGGAAYTSNGVGEVVHAIFSRVSRKTRRYALADSGFCNVGFFNACANANCGFVTAGRSNMFDSLIHRVTNWKVSKAIKFHDGREVDIGTTLYKPKHGRQILRVIYIRALRNGEQSKALFDDARYNYHAFFTNIGEHEMSNEKLIEFYRSRSDVENFIKEIKGGLDLKHFPCASLIANKAYGLIAAFAYNLMRFMARVENPRQPHFAKLLRFRMLMLPVEVVKHARSISFRFMEHHRKEVLNWLDIIKNSQLGFDCSTSQATTAAL